MSNKNKNFFRVTQDVYHFLIELFIVENSINKDAALRNARAIGTKEKKPKSLLDSYLSTDIMKPRFHQVISIQCESESDAYNLCEQAARDAASELLFYHNELDERYMEVRTRVYSLGVEDLRYIITTKSLGDCFGDELKQKIANLIEQKSKPASQRNDINLAEPIDIDIDIDIDQPVDPNKVW